MPGVPLTAPKLTGASSIRSFGESAAGPTRTLAGGPCPAAPGWLASGLVSPPAMWSASARSLAESGCPLVRLMTRKAVALLLGAPNAVSITAWARADSYPAGNSLAADCNGVG